MADVSNRNGEKQSNLNKQKYDQRLKNSLNRKLQQSVNNSEIGAAIKDSIEKHKNNKARNTIEKKIDSHAKSPLGSALVKSSLKTDGGQDYIDTFRNSSSETEGLQKIALKAEFKIKMIKIALPIALVVISIIFVLFLIVSIFKNADTQIYSNENDGKLDTEQYQDNDLINPNIFVKYPGIYEKVEAAAEKVGNKYKVDIDKYLILATLIAPIENGNITPVADGACGEIDCYYFDGRLVTWVEFLELWGDQSEYLAKAQILTYVNESSDIDVTCSGGKNTEAYAKNDMTVNEFSFWKLFNPFNWFSGFRSVADAEVNAKCIPDVPIGESSIPTVYVISKEQGIYYPSINANNERTYVKDESTGGVYFWNLVNNGGFIHVYMKDYLNVSGTESDDQNYESNLTAILDIGNYIYSYYESIRKDCSGYLLIESTIEDIKVSDGGGGYYEVPLEDYVGGVVLAEIGGGGSLDNMMAFAVLARSYGVSYVGTDGSGVILNSSDAQNYDPDYSAEKYPNIAEAVEKTKGLVVTKYGQSSVFRTSYDAFCPTTSEPQKGFYYLSDSQNNLPINPDAYQTKTGQSFSINPEYTECPCFQNKDSRPANTMFGGSRVRFATSPTRAPNHAGGYPYQATNVSCWTYTGSSRYNELTFTTEYAWEYKPTGGHGNGASQYGLKYYAGFEYEWEALIKLFFPDASIKRLSSSLEDGECQNASIYEGGSAATIDSCGVTFEVSDSNYTKTIRGNPLNKPLTEALSNAGYTIECLNGCISQRVATAGTGTREGVVEAAVGLLECTMEMTGGFTYPYDHRGGYTPRNPDIAGKLGVNSRWGEYEDWATGCSSSKCRLGLNCANYVRWSMCNGGMNFCESRSGDTYATGITGVNTDAPDYFPGAIRIYITGNSFYVTPDISISELSSGYKASFSNQYSDSAKLATVNIDKVLSLVQPGDVLYSDKNGGSNHAMVIVGVTDSALWIAENGRNTEMVTYDDLKDGNKNYVILLLDAFYENSNNRNNLSW